MHRAGRLISPAETADRLWAAASGGSHRSRIPLGRAHDIFARSESVIVGYYTFAPRACFARKSASPGPQAESVKGDLWQETTGLTVPVPEM